eukprot:gene28236-35059_t
MRGLQTFYAQENSFSGPLTSLFVSNATARVSLSFVDVSNNALTGTLPDKLFMYAIDTLESFAAASNCITGSISELICDVKYLTFLDLDGLSTAKPCRQQIFAHTSVSQSFVLKNQVSEGIPQCLFNMSSLETLHLSGNEIEWSFPEGFDPPLVLQTLSLSHNKITGTIPTSIFSRFWTSLDLSYNKLSGEIGEQFGLLTIVTSRRMLFQSTAAVCLIALPVYGVLALRFKTLNNSYAYVISAAYLSGATPALVLFVLLSTRQQMVKGSQSQTRLIFASGPRDWRSL